MTVEATMVHECPEEELQLTLEGSGSAGEIIQLPDGRAGFIDGLNDPASGAKVTVRTQGVVTVPKTASIVLLDGGEVYWDFSANKAHFKKVNDQDFYLGTVVGDAASSDTELNVDLNRKPAWLIDMAVDGYDSAVVLTAGAPLVRDRGGKIELLFDTTAEAQKVDALSLDAFAIAANAIITGKVTIVTNADAAAGDFNIGIANGTHASDADAITESVFLHVDGASTNILAESDDGSTEVNATDTTVDFTAGTEFEFWIDVRDPTDIQIYIDGVNVLPSSAFKLNAGSGPMKLLAHFEKTSNDSPGEIHVRHFRARIAHR